MKTWRYIVVVLLVFLTACYEVNEEIVINKDGSGTYATKIDLSAMLQLMQSMASEEELAKNGLGRAIDTTISMKEILDSAKDATPEQRRLFSTGLMKLKMNMAENIFIADVNFKFNNYNDLQLLMAGNGVGGLGDIFKKVLSKDSTQEVNPDNGFDQFNTVFDISAKNGLLSRKLNQPKYDSLMNRPEMAQAKQMMNTGFEILYTTTIRLPRAVKKTDNDLIKLSEDKKTVTIKYDLLKMLQTPEKFSYSIEY